jgi:predicted ATPase
VVLDDCDPLLEVCAALARDLLRGGAHLRVLATSRQSLGLPGELVWRVPSLAEADAAALFQARASQAGGAAADAAVAAQICRRLDGIPQAILLAAARTRALAADQIAARLDDRFRLLTGGSRAGLPRHRTLAATIDWSYQLLDAEEQAVLAELSVFSGGCTLEAAAAVHGGEVLDTLDRLVDRSLVLFDGRYRLLETVRAYARERLAEAGRLDAIRRRHAEAFVALAEAAEPHVFCARGDDLWMARLDAETDNLRAALEATLVLDPPAAPRLVASLLWYWFDRGRLHEAGAAVAAVLPLLGQVSREVAAKALAAGGWVTVWDRDHSRALPRFEAGVAIARELGDLQLVAYGLCGCGVARLVDDDVAGARRDMDEAERLSREGVDPAVRVFVLQLLGGALQADGDPDAARERLEQSLALAREQDLRTLTGHGLVVLGQHARARGDLRAAWSILLEGAHVVRPADTCARSRLLGTMGWLALDEGQMRLGARLLGAAERLHEQTGVTLFVPQRPDFAAAQKVARRALPEGDFSRAWADGHRHGADAVIAELEELTAAWSRRASGS